MPSEVLRGTVLIVGPDGSGKSTVVDAISRQATGRGVRVGRAHHRPGLLFGGSEGREVTDPHGRPPRSLLFSLAKLVMVFADHLIGGRLRWGPMRTSGLLLLERGWIDMVVDPRRYRLPVRSGPLVRAAARLLPRPDLVLLLTGDPDELHRRKPEIGAFEVGRQVQDWRRLGPSAGRRVLEMDSVVFDAETIADRVLNDLGATDLLGQWRRVRFTPARLEMCAVGRCGPALAVYQPQSRRAKVGATVARRRIPRTGPQVVEPVPGLRELWKMLDIHPNGAVSMKSSTADRYVLAVCRDGLMEAVVKIGSSDDSALRHEAGMLAESISPQAGIRRPEVVWAGEWRSYFVLVTRAVLRSHNDVWSADEVVPVIEALSKAGPDGAPLTHGDLASWNLVRTVEGPVLLDWESARWSDEPLHDLAHFVVSEGALLGRYDPAAAMSLLCDPESPGERLLHLRGRTGADSRRLLVDYLSAVSPREPRAVRFTSEMMRLATL